MAETKGECSLECGREVHYTSVGLCKACYSRLRQQRGRGLRWAVARSRQIASWQQGLDWVTSGRAEAIPAPRKRKKARKKA